MENQKQNLPSNNNDLDRQTNNQETDGIKASDASRNQERDEKIGEEPDTKRLRSERESAKQGRTGQE